MSNKKLFAATAGRYMGPFFPASLDNIQAAYETRRHKKHPITPEFLEYFAQELGLVFQQVKFDPDFTTDDNTPWRGASFLYVSGRKYKIAFPKNEDFRHRDGTISGHHIALYCLSDEEIPEDELDNVSQAILALFNFARRGYPH